jgi:hypothetical protein
MPTMYILCLKYVCYFTGPTVTIPFESKWCIKSVEKDTYIKKKEKSPVVSTNDIGSDDDDVLGNDNLEKRRSKPNHPWLYIDEALLMHEQCIGEAIPNSLKQDVVAKRLTQIHYQRSLPDGDPNKKPDDFEFKIECTQHVFCTENLMSMPCYTFGERQVAGTKYENDHYIGKLIDAVDLDGRQRTSNEVLTKEWIARNTTQAIRELLHAKQNVFIWVPVGAPHLNSYPYIYDKKLP